MWCHLTVSRVRMRKTCFHLLKIPGELCHTTPDRRVCGRQFPYS